LGIVWFEYERGKIGWLSLVICSGTGNMDDTYFSKNGEKFCFQWHITEKCNLQCNHCYQDNYTAFADISIQELKDITNKLLPTLSKWKKKGDISITGGEPIC